MNDKCWYNLKIDTKLAFRNTWSPPPLDRESDVKDNANWIWDFPGDVIFSNEWLELLSKFDLTVKKAMVFYKPANFINRWAHIDTIGINAPDETVIFAMNWVISGLTGDMFWYDIPSGERIVRWTTSHRPYLAWPVSALTKIDHCAINDKLTLVRTDIPHAITVKDESRWCVSVRLHYLENSWQEVVDSMNRKNLLVER